MRPYLALALLALPNYQLAPKIDFAASCDPWRPMLEKRIAAGVARFQDCLNFAFVREDIARRMAEVLSGHYPISVECDEPPDYRWCAAGGYGRIILSPSRMLTPGSICYPDIEAFFVHESGHVADLAMGPVHNEQGDTGEFDEVYSIQNYCMRPARMWLFRSTRTADVVDPDRLECVRAYQEFTPETGQDPFWGAYQAQMSAGTDPCPAPAAPPASSMPVAKKRHGWLWRWFHH